MYMRSAPLHMQVNPPPRVVDFTQALSDGEKILDEKDRVRKPLRSNMADLEMNEF